MILTGKAKEDFLKYYGTGENYFTTTITDVEQCANIIEWLDSVGIYTQVELWQPGYMGDVNYMGNIWYVENYYKHYDEASLDVDGVYDTRQEAMKQAIIKANEIYNSL